MGTSVFAGPSAFATFIHEQILEFWAVYLLQFHSENLRALSHSVEVFPLSECPYPTGKNSSGKIFRSFSLPCFHELGSWGLVFIPEFLMVCVNLRILWSSFFSHSLTLKKWNLVNNLVNYSDSMFFRAIWSDQKFAEVCCTTKRMYISLCVIEPLSWAKFVEQIRKDF